MAAPFSDWQLEDVQKAIEASIVEKVGSDEAFDTNAAFIEDHDHWQKGETWVGPNGGSNEAVRAAVLTAVERQFTPRDAIGEVLDRMANALLKREPDVDFAPLEPIPDPDVPEDADQATIDQLRADVEQRRDAQRAAGEEMKRNISAWWDRKKLWQLARHAVKRSRWAGRGGLRTWIAPGNLQQTPASSGSDATDTAAPSTVRLPTGLAFLDALMRVELSAPRPDTVCVHVDQETQQAVGLFTYHDDEVDADKAELWFIDDPSADKPKTVLRIVTDGDNGDAEEFPVELGGRLPIVEMEAEVLITEPVRRQQNRLNFHESVLVRVGEVAGFPERYTINAEPGGMWLETPPAGTAPLATQTFGGKTYYLNPAPRTLGAAITTDLVGIITKSGADEERATPQVVFRDPTDPEYAIKACDHAYFTLLKQCKQGHLAVTSTAESSGVAYEQARADYEADLEAVRGPLEGMLREIIEVAIAWAEAMSGPQVAAAAARARSFLETYRVVVTLKVNAGPITAAAQQQNNDNVKAGTLSRSSAMAASQIEDVQAELDKIMSDPAALVELRGSQATAITVLVAEGMGWEDAGRFTGIDDQDLLRLLKQADAAAAEREAQARTQADELAAQNGGGESIDAILSGTRPAKKPATPAAAAAGAGA